jgi:hypothetical protein
MSTALLLRIAAVISLLFAAGHTLGGSQLWSPLGETEVLKAMRTFRFETSGVSRTYLDFYLGFGFTISVYLLLQAILLWQLAAIAGTEPLRVRPMIASFALASLACGILSWRFIFPLPVVFSGVLTACLGLAFRSARSERLHHG